MRRCTWRARRSRSEAWETTTTRGLDQGEDEEAGRQVDVGRSSSSIVAEGGATVDRGGTEFL